MQDLKVSFHLLRQTGRDSFHPFDLGYILVETDSKPFTSPAANSNTVPFLLSEVTELLLGLADLLTDKRKKKYAFTPIESGFPLVFEKRKKYLITRQFLSPFVSPTNRL